MSAQLESTYKPKCQLEMPRTADVYFLYVN